VAGFFLRDSLSPVPAHSHFAENNPRDARPLSISTKAVDDPALWLMKAHEQALSFKSVKTCAAYVRSQQRFSRRGNLVVGIGPRAGADSRDVACRCLLIHKSIALRRINARRVSRFKRYKSRVARRADIASFGASRSKARFPK
jgi:hypothetical protein